jgi:glycosyltransferase involved in cell wall biosynthesis
MALKLAVVAIAKNEAQFAHRFLKSCEGADYVIVADTGSTDPTVKELWRAWDELPQVGDLRVHPISVQPWRFDAARNTSLALTPPDVDFCITLDLDEILVDGWRDKVDRAVAKAPMANRIWYGYVWNFAADGVTPITRFKANRIYARSGYRWIYPCHETIVRYADGPEIFAEVDGDLIHHHADDTKPRSSYLPLLEMAVRENPHDRRVALYLLREQLYAGDVTHEGALLFGRWAVSQGFFVEGLNAIQLAVSLAKDEGELIHASRALAEAHTKQRGGKRPSCT